MVRKQVGELEHGDCCAEYGTVTHREGRKVWFEDRIVTFPSSEEELLVVAGEDSGR